MTLRLFIRCVLVSIVFGLYALEGTSETLRGALTKANNQFKVKSCVSTNAGCQFHLSLIKDHARFKISEGLDGIITTRARSDPLLSGWLSEGHTTAEVNIIDVCHSDTVYFKKTASHKYKRLPIVVIKEIILLQDTGFLVIGFDHPNGKTGRFFWLDHNEAIDRPHWVVKPGQYLCINREGGCWVYDQISKDRSVVLQLNQQGEIVDTSKISLWFDSTNRDDMNHRYNDEIGHQSKNTQHHEVPVKLAGWLNWLHQLSSCVYQPQRRLVDSGEVIQRCAFLGLVSQLDHATDLQDATLLERLKRNDSDRLLEDAGEMIKRLFNGIPENIRTDLHHSFTLKHANFSKLPIEYKGWIEHDQVYPLRLLSRTI